MLFEDIAKKLTTVPPKGIGGYRPPLGVCAGSSAVYGEGHEVDSGPIPLPFLSSFSTLALLPLALLLPFAIAMAFPHCPGLVRNFEQSNSNPDTLTRIPIPHSAFWHFDLHSDPDTPTPSTLTLGTPILILQGQHFVVDTSASL